MKCPRFPQSRCQRADYQPAEWLQNERNVRGIVAGIRVEAQTRGRREGRIPCCFLFR
jgi:hypothetical protein